MAKDVKKNKGALWATILGVVVFIKVYIATGAVNGAVARGAVAPDKIGTVNGLNGIFSQIQVLGIIVAVLLDRKRGYMIGTGLQIFGTLQVLIIQIILRHNMAAMPGAVTGLVSIFIYTIPCCIHGMCCWVFFIYLHRLNQQFTLFHFLTYSVISFVTLTHEFSISLKSS